MKKLSLFIAVVALLSGLMYSMQPGKLSEHCSVLQELCDLGFNPLNSGFPGLTASPVSPTPAPSPSPKALGRNTPNWIEVSSSQCLPFQERKIIIKPTEEQVKKIIVTISRNQEFGRDKQNLFKSAKKDLINLRINMYLDALKKMVMRSLKSSSFDFELDTMYINSISRSIAEKMLYADVKILVCEYLFHKMANCLACDTVSVYQDAINLLSTAKKDPKISYIIKNFHDETNGHFERNFDNSVANDMVKYISSQPSMQNLSVLLEQKVRQEDFEKRNFAKQEAEQAMKERDQLRTQL